MLIVFATVTVCPCNVRGNCRTPAKQLEGMPTIQSTIGILLGTLGVIGELWPQFHSKHPEIIRKGRGKHNLQSFYVLVYRYYIDCYICKTVLPESHTTKQNLSGTSATQSLSVMSEMLSFVLNLLKDLSLLNCNAIVFFHCFYTVYLGFSEKIKIRNH